MFGLSGYCYSRAMWTSCQDRASKGSEYVHLLVEERHLQYHYVWMYTYKSPVWMILQLLQQVNVIFHLPSLSLSSAKKLIIWFRGKALLKWPREPPGCDLYNVNKVRKKCKNILSYRKWYVIHMANILTSVTLRPSN